MNKSVTKLLKKQLNEDYKRPPTKLEFRRAKKMYLQIKKGQ